jgi:transcriptional regulator with XRE-family HTH domain
VATMKINRKPKISIIPSAADSKNAGEFDEIAESLGLTKGTRPRRWLLRIGAMLQHMREHGNLKQEKMAQTAGVTQAYLSRLENGVIPKRGPTVEVLLRCAEAADCNIEIAIRSRKNNELLGSVSSKDLDDSVYPHTQFASAPSGQTEGATADPDVINLILEHSHVGGARTRVASHRRTYMNDFAEPAKKIEQAWETLASILEAYKAHVTSLRGTRHHAVQVKTVDLGPRSGRAATDLVEALEVVWPFRISGLTRLSGHEVRRTNTVKVGAGDLLVIEGADSSASTGTVRVFEATELLKSVESEA